MLEKITVALIVALCAFFIGRRFFRQLSGTKKKSGCGCSCTGCESPAKNETCCTDAPKQQKE